MLTKFTKFLLIVLNLKNLIIHILIYSSEGECITSGNIVFNYVADNIDSIIFTFDFEKITDDLWCYLV